MTDDYKERLFKWFADESGRNRFELSMGEKDLSAASRNCLIRFLAHAVAEKAVTDPQYLASVVAGQPHIIKMLKDPEFEKIPKHHAFYMTVGAVFACAIEALASFAEEET